MTQKSKIESLVKTIEEGDIRTKFGRKRRGKVTGLGYIEFVAELLILNEDRSHPWTDTSIAAAMAKEFPTFTETVLKNRRKGKRGREREEITLVPDVGRFRRELNRRDIPQHPNPEKLSMRYNDDGKPVNKTGRWMTFEQFTKVCAHFKIDDPRLANPPKGLFREGDL